MNTKKENISISFKKDNMIISFTDGRAISVPLALYPRLLKGTAKQRNNWEVIGNNRGFHWSDLDEDLSLEGILHGIPAPDYKKSKRKNNNNTTSELRV